MSNKLYPTGKEQFLKGLIDWESDTLKVALLTSAYTYSSSHVYYSEVSGVVGTPQTIASATLTAGSTTVVADGNNVTFSSVTSGNTVTQYVIYKDSGTSSTSPLIGHFDTSTALPFNTTGGDITIVWPASGIFEF